MTWSFHCIQRPLLTKEPSFSIQWVVGIMKTSVFTELGFNDKPGRIELGNTGLPLTPGQAVYEPVVNPVPTNSNEDYSDAACGGPCYSLTATAS